MYVKKIEFKNFKAQGPKKKEFEFPPKRIKLIYGENGTGKTTITKAFDFIFNMDDYYSEGCLDDQISIEKNRIVTDDEVFINIELAKKENGPVFTYKLENNKIEEDKITEFRKEYKRNYFSLSYADANDLFPKHSDQSNLLSPESRRLEHKFFEVIIGRFLGKLSLPDDEFTIIERIRKIKELDSNSMQFEDEVDRFNKDFSIFTEKIRKNFSNILKFFVKDSYYSDYKIDFDITYNNFRFKIEKVIDKNGEGKEKVMIIDDYWNVLNEGFFTLIAISLFFAIARNQMDKEPGLLLIDDLLLGIDQINKVTFLAALNKFFPKDQVILLTFDEELKNIFFQESYNKIRNKKDILYNINYLPNFIISDNLEDYFEIYEELKKPSKGIPLKIQRNTRAMTLRLALEQIVKKLAKSLGIRVRYDFLHNIKKQSGGKLIARIRDELTIVHEQSKRKLETFSISDTLTRMKNEKEKLQELRNIVDQLLIVNTDYLNPSSHDSPKWATEIDLDESYRILSKSKKFLIDNKLIKNEK